MTVVLNFQGEIYIMKTFWEQYIWMFEATYLGILFWNYSIVFRGGYQCTSGGWDPGGIGLVSGPTGVHADPQERVRHGSQQVQANAQQGALRLFWKQQIWEPNCRSHNIYLLWWIYFKVQYKQMSYPYSLFLKVVKSYEQSRAAVILFSQYNR